MTFLERMVSGGDEMEQEKQKPNLPAGERLEKTAEHEARFAPGSTL